MIIHGKNLCHIIVHGFTHDESCVIIHIESFCHINVHVESHGEPCNMYIFFKKLFSFLLVNI
jgi:hypothetical protein